MRILIICNSLWYPAVKRSGMSAVYNLLNELVASYNVELHVLTSLSQAGERLDDRKNIYFHYVTVENFYIQRPILYFKAFKLGQKYSFNIIHDFSSLPFLIGFTGLLGKLCECLTAHTLCTVNTKWIGSPRLAWGSSLVDSVTCVDKLRQHKLEEDNIMCSYTPLGLRNGAFFDLEYVGDSRRVLFLGPLEERKGAFVLASSIPEVVKRHPDAKFVFAFYGKEVRDPDFGAHYQKLEKITQNVSDSVEFEEGKHNVPGLMEKSSIFILPATSRHGTLGQPLTLLEAMSAGRACIVSNIYEGAGLVEDGKNCLLFKSGDSADLANKIDQLISNSELRQELSRNGRQTVKDGFTVQDCAGKIYSLYEDLVL